MADILTLGEARAALNIPSTDSSNDSELLTVYVPAVTSIVEDVVGPVVTRAATYTTDGQTSMIVLPGGNVQSITTVTVNGVTLAASGYAVDLNEGAIYSASGAFAWAWNYPVVVTYVAGIAANTAAVPAAIKLAARLILASLWQSDQQGYRPELGAPEQEMTPTPAGFSIPPKAYALLEPYATATVAGIA